PLKCREEMGVKKCDGRSRRTAGQAGAVGKRMKQTDRPRQSQSEPRCRQSQPARGNTQPKQFVIGLARSKRSANDLHWSLVNGSEVRMRRSQSSVREQLAHRNIRSPQGQ